MLEMFNLKRLMKKDRLDKEDLKKMIRLLGRLARKADRLKVEYSVVKSFCAGLADVFKEADNLKEASEPETKIQINNILKISSDMLTKTEEELRSGKEGYGKIGDIKINIIDILNGLAAALQQHEIPKVAGIA